MIGAAEMGGLVALLAWLALNIYAIYLSSKRVKYTWTVAIILNLIVGGIFLPTWVGMILPIIYIYLVKSHKPKKEAKA